MEENNEGEPLSTIKLLHRDVMDFIVETLKRPMTDAEEELLIGLIRKRLEHGAFPDSGSDCGSDSSLRTVSN